MIAVSPEEQGEDTPTVEDRRRGMTQFHRTKMCVIGPPGSGKSKMVRALVGEGGPQNIGDESTVLMDKIVWRFAHGSKADTLCEVNLWDISGRQEYKAARSLVYSNDTLYVLVVDLKAYADVIDLPNYVDRMRSGGTWRISRDFTNFFFDHTFRWARTISDQHTGAKFVLVGTKSDLVDPGIVEKICNKLPGVFVDLAQKMEIEVVEQHLPRLVHTAMFAVSDQAPGNMVELRNALQSSVEADPTFECQVTDLYFLLLTQVEHIRKEAKLMPTTERIAKCFVTLADLKRIVKEKTELDFGENDFREAMTYLHLTGDVLWYNDLSNPSEYEYEVLLAPQLVVDVIRQVVNHKYCPDPECKASHDEGHSEEEELNARMANMEVVDVQHGRLTHDLLKSLDLWKDVDEETLKRLKKLLARLDVAYLEHVPGDASVLVVPSYWGSAGDLVGRDENNASQINGERTVRWEYHFQKYIPDDMFYKLAVHTVDRSCKRTAIRTNGSKVIGFYDLYPSAEKATITVDRSRLNLVVLGVEVVGPDRASAWKVHSRYCAKLQRLIRTYPGVSAKRYAFDLTVEDAQKKDVDNLLASLKSDIESNDPKSHASVYLPSDMTWYDPKETWLKTMQTRFTATTPVPDGKPKESTVTLTDFDTLRVGLGSIKDGKVIGHGAYGDVWLVQLSKNGKPIPAVSKRSKGKSPAEVEVSLKEMAIHMRLEHPRIVKLVGAAWTTLMDFQILFEYMDGGDLSVYLKSLKVIEPWNRQKHQIALDVIEALAHVHAHKPRPIVHRDLKGGNILLSRESTSEPLFRAKIADFGISRVCAVELEAMTRQKGTVLWMAPEVMQGKPYDHRCDIFSFGALLSELDNQVYPYSNFDPNELEALRRQISDGKAKPIFSSMCPEEISKFAKQCVETDPDARPTAATIYAEFQKIKVLKGW